jgi:uncharacterized membrane protein (UPF0127 family)
MNFSLNYNLQYKNLVRLCFGLLLVLNVGFAACTPQKLKTTELVIERAGEGQVVITAEVAITNEERSNGLMFRKKLADGEGMIFVFDRDQLLNFWMKNTFIPLSIAFIASDGRIVEIRDMQPHDLNSILSSRSVRYALEVPQGWFSRAGISPGDKLKIDF